MKHPLSSLAELFTAKVQYSVHNTEEKVRHQLGKNQSDADYKEAIRSFAYPLGRYFSGEFDTAEELFEYLQEEDLLSEETVHLLEGDREFVHMFEQGLSADEEHNRDGEYDEDYGDEECEYDEEEEGYNPLCL